MAKRTSTLDRRRRLIDAIVYKCRIFSTPNMPSEIARGSDKPSIVFQDQAQSLHKNAHDIPPQRLLSRLECPSLQ
jgi:hypothetical protein